MEKPVDLSCFPQVSEIITLPVFRDSSVLGGASGMARLVEGINLSDTPEYYKWLSKGELMVTTCYAIHRDPAALETFVKNLAERDMAAVCIKPAQYLGQIPRSMVEQADEYGLPLIELPAGVRFSDITKSVSDELMRRQTALLRSTLQVNEMLTRTIIEGAGLDDIAGMVCQLTGVSVLILDTINNRRALHIAGADRETLGAMPQEKAVHAVVTNSSVHELTVGNYSFGYLYLYRFDEASDLQPDILRQVLQTIPLEISRESSIQKRKDNGFSVYLRHLLTDPIPDNADESARAAEYGLELEHTHMLLQIEIDEQKDSHGRYAVEFQRTLLTSNLLSMLTNLALSPRIITSTQGYWLLVSAPEAGDLAPLSGRFPELFLSLSREYPALKLTGGCGRLHPGLNGMRESCREAGVALRAAASRDGMLLRFEDLGVLRLIYAQDPEREISRYVYEKLGILLDQGQLRNADLLRTLEAYFEQFGNVKRVSEVLFTHYNTVNYRLKHIQEITGSDFRNATDRFELELALRLYRFQTQSAE